MPQLSCPRATSTNLAAIKPSLLPVVFAVAAFVIYQFFLDRSRVTMPSTLDESHADTLLSSLAAVNIKPAGEGTSLIPASFRPTTQLSISFGDKRVEPGNLVRASEAQLAPTVSFDPEDPASSHHTYALLMLDPDAPSPDDPKFAWWRHWVLTGLKPGRGAEEHRTTVGTVTAYLAPGPKDDSKPHRYLFLLFREPEGFRPADAAGDVGGETFVERRSFGAEAFVKRHGLELVGLNWMLGVGDGWVEEGDHGGSQWRYVPPR